VQSAVEFLEKRSETAQLLQLRALTDELEVHLRGELDLVEEASNTELIGQQLADYEDLVVPQVIRPHVTKRVLVLEATTASSSRSTTGCRRSGRRLSRPSSSAPTSGR